MNSELENTIGKSLEDTKNLDWYGYWPVVDEDGIITDVLDSDGFDCDSETLIDYSAGRMTIVDGSHGFDAVLRK